MFCHYRTRCAGDKTAGQDVSLEYRRQSKTSWSGSARHPFGTTDRGHVKSSPLVRLLPRRGLGQRLTNAKEFRARSPLLGTDLGAAWKTEIILR